MAGYYTDKNGNLVKFAGSSTETKFALPVGSIFPSAIPLTDASVHLLDGSFISQTGVYQEFAELVKSLSNAGYNITCSQEEFDSEVSATGNCGKFVINNTVNTIRLPKITRFIQGLSSMIDIGKSLEAGLPNITGTINCDRFDGTYDNNLFQPYTRQTLLGGNSSITTTNTGINFDASRFNSIYGNSSTVQPQATSFPYYIVLASGFYSDTNFNINNIVADLNLKQDKLQANIMKVGETHTKQNDTVIDYWVSSDRNSWYRIWASGWKECGGTILASSSNGVGQTFTLPLPNGFSDTNWYVWYAGTSDMFSISGNVVYAEYGITPISRTQFRMTTWLGHNRQWVACGW